MLNPFVLSNYPGQNRFFEQNDGVVSQTVTSEGYREGLRWLRTLFEAGLFGEESFSQSYTELRQQVDGGDAPTLGAVMAGYPGIFASLGGDHWLRYNAIPPLEGPTGLRQTPFSPWGIVSGQCVISPKTEHPEAAFKWCEGLYGREATMRSVYGVPESEAAAGEDSQWRWAEEGEQSVGGADIPAIWKATNIYGTLQNAIWAERGPNYRPNRLRLGEVRHANSALEVVLYEQTKAAYEPYARAIEDLIPPLALTREQAAEVTELRLGITDYVAQMTAEFVLGRQDLDAGWHNFVATIEALGIDRIVEIYQVAYDAQFGG